MRKIGLLAIIGLLLTTPITVFVSNASAAGKAKGSISDINLAAGTITIATKDSFVTLTLDERTSITRNGEQVSLSGLQLTDKVVIKTDGRGVPRKLEATGVTELRLERVEGSVSGVNEAESTLTIVRLHDPEPVTLHVTRRTYITLDGREAALSDLARGYTAGAMFDPEMDAVRVQAESYAEVRGIVRDVGVATGTLTIATGGRDGEITLNVPPGTPISLNDRPASLEDLRRGFEVRASYVEASLQAVRIAATSRVEVQGVIRAVDLEGATVTISPLVEGSAVQVHVTNSTAITINGERATLERLQAGMPAKVVFLLGSFEAISIAARSDGGDECTVVGVTGGIVRVDVEGGHVVIRPAEGVNDVTLNVTNRTEITVNGRPARLSDLEVGMRAAARFCRENHNALAVAAQSDEPDCTVSGVSGLIVRVDVEGGRLAIQPADGPNAVTLNITDRTEITLNGRPARLSELRIGMRAEVRFCRETLTALAVAAHSDDPPACTATGAAGVIARVDVEGGHLAINVVSSTTESVLVLNVLNRTEITLNGRAARLSDLRVGMRVEARFCRETLDAIVIAATAETGGDCTAASVAGTIAGVEADRGHLAIASGTGTAPLVLTVTNRTEISLDGRPARLSDLRVGMSVEARFCRETLVALTVAARSSTAR